ncbi:HYR domain-containing protein [Halobacillus litoralis]|uniref:HYR domain-containing protein n=1 Tax=Halobacillus litoralis TaxID=45668 RepID=UPI00136DC966
MATDASGNESEPCTFEIMVNDTEPPTITCPDDFVVMVEPGETGSVVNYPDPIFTDNCPGVMSSCSPASGSFFPLGTTEVTCTAEDAAGNMTNCTFNIQVEVAGQNALQLELIISQEIQVVHDTTIEVEGRFAQPNSAQILQNDNELVCINVQKVYDWVAFCREVQREVSIPAECDIAILECTNTGGNITVECEVIPNATGIMVLENIRPAPGIPGTSIVPIRFTVLLQIRYYCDDLLACEFEAPICYVEEVILCYPEGTSILAKGTNVQCLSHLCHSE